MSNSSDLAESMKHYFSECIHFSGKFIQVLAERVKVARIIGTKFGGVTCGAYKRLLQLS